MSLFIRNNNFSSHLYVVNADFKQPPYYPEIKFIPQQKLSKMACEKPCPVIGWYPTKDQKKGKEVLYMIEGVYPVQDLCIRTILLHELVHFWQDYNDAFENSGDSLKVVFTRREQQAMILEHLYRGQEYTKYRILSMERLQPSRTIVVAPPPSKFQIMLFLSSLFTSNLI